MMFEVSADTKIPRLSPDLKLIKGGIDEDGQPFWRLYHPVSHQYFQIGWVEFEYLSRFSFCETYDDLASLLHNQTTLEPETDVFKELLLFLNQHGLILETDGLPLTPPQKEKSLLSELVHKYLFFSLPIFRPQNFLKATYPYLAFLFSREATFFSVLLLILGVIMTLGRADEFIHTFMDLFSAEGAMMIAIIFTIIKLFHELGHAYTAHKYGLKVPHMGIAFMVMYPVFYTETTAAWHLASKKEKIEIGLAGIRIELMLASIFLLIWNFSAPGTLQSIAFSIVSISLIGSLLINLNPLMRFDGYFILSDMLSIENLHARSFACARWALRKTLFGWKDECPEYGRPEKIKFFIIFGWAILIYRFFLFLGIAYLVYVLFPKPLGLILMGIELLWFIGKPILSELKIWATRRQDILIHARGKISVLLFACALCLLFIPLNMRMQIPALIHAAEYRDIYAPYPAQIISLNVTENRMVKASEVLIYMQSEELERDYNIAKNSLQELEKIKRRRQTDAALLREDLDQLENEIKELSLKVSSFEVKKEQLVIKAPYDSIIKDGAEDLHEGLYVGQEKLLFRLIKPQVYKVSAYVTEQQFERLKAGTKGSFRADYALADTIPVKVQDIEQTNISSLDKKELSSLYGGSIYSEFFTNGYEEERIVPRQTLYKVTLTPDVSDVPFAATGKVMMSGEKIAPIVQILIWAYSIILPESDVIS